MKQKFRTRAVTSEELRSMLRTPIEASESQVPTAGYQPAIDSIPEAQTAEAHAPEAVSTAMPKTAETGASTQSVADTIRARREQSSPQFAPKTPTATEIIAQRKASGKTPITASEMIRQRKTGKAAGTASDPRAVIFARKFSCK